MTFIVETPEHGEYEFDADQWETLAGELGDEGNLFISKDGLGVAEFAKGAWVSIRNVEPAVAPGRTVVFWDKIHEVPEHVETVADRDGDEWSRHGEDWGNPDHWLNDYAPFREAQA